MCHQEHLSQRHSPMGMTSQRTKGEREDKIRNSDVQGLCLQKGSVNVH